MLGFKKKAKWEYLITVSKRPINDLYPNCITMEDGATESLYTLGLKGFELVGIVPDINYTYIHYFKKRID